jgi:uncharacterized protein (TIGR00369 family)
MTYEPRNPDFRDTINSKFEKNVFAHHIGFRLTLVVAGHVEGELDIQEVHHQQTGMIHGGVTSTVADIVMGFAAYSLVDKGQGTVTSDLKIAYLRPGEGRKLVARGRVIKAGRLLYYCEADVLSVDELGSEVLIARGYSTMCAVKAGSR